MREHQSGGVSAGDPYRGGQIQPMFRIGFSFSSGSALSPRVGCSSRWFKGAPLSGGVATEDPHTGGQIQPVFRIAFSCSGGAFSPRVGCEHQVV